MKTCAKCNKSKVYSDFQKNKARADGVQTYCKKCANEINRKRDSSPKRKAARKQWVTDNPDKVREIGARYDALHRTKRNEAAKLRRQMFPQQYRERSRAGFLRRRARKLAVPHERYTRLEIADRDKWICHLCDEKVDPQIPSSNDPGYGTCDHLVPLAQGGPDLKSNLKLAHRHCNSTRRDLPISIAREKLAMARIDANKKFLGPFGPRGVYPGWFW